MILINHFQNIKSFVCLSFLGVDWFYTHFLLNLVNLEKCLFFNNYLQNSSNMFLKMLIYKEIRLRVMKLISIDINGNINSKMCLFYHTPFIGIYYYLVVFVDKKKMIFDI